MILAVAVDNHRSTIAVIVTIMIATLLYDHGIAIPVVALADHVAIAIPITVTAGGSDGHAVRTHTYSNFFRTGRHCTANSGRRDGYYC
jgi:hypothetical protein